MQRYVVNRVEYKESMNPDGSWCLNPEVQVTQTEMSESDFLELLEDEIKAFQSYGFNPDPIKTKIANKAREAVYTTGCIINSKQFKVIREVA